MSRWRKPDEDLVRLLDETIAGLEFAQAIDFRPMFGKAAEHAASLPPRVKRPRMKRT